MDEVRQNLANFEDAAGPVGNLIMARHSGLYIFCFWFFSPLGHIAAFDCFLSFLASEIWKWSPDASGNKALGLWIICSIFSSICYLLLRGSGASGDGCALIAGS